MAQMIEATCDVCIYDPFGFEANTLKECHDRIVLASSRSEPRAVWFKACLPFGF
jgi:hypothetical protein